MRAWRRLCSRSADPRQRLFTRSPRVVVYEDEQSNTFLACDSFVSLLAQYQREEITQVARLVEHKLEALVAEVTAAGGA